jgi:hypothetical protein
MVFEIEKQRYKNQIGSEFKHLHWWKAVRQQPKWRARPAASSTTDLFLSSSDPATEEEVTCPIGRDRARWAHERGKGRKVEVVKVSFPP